MGPGNWLVYMIQLILKYQHKILFSYSEDSSKAPSALISWFINSIFLDLTCGGVTGSSFNIVDMEHLWFWPFSSLNPSFSLELLAAFSSVGIEALTSSAWRAAVTFVIGASSTFATISLRKSNSSVSLMHCFLKWN